MIISLLLFTQEVKIKKDPVNREFKRAKGGERRLKVCLDMQIKCVIYSVNVLNHINLSSASPPLERRAFL